MSTEKFTNGDEKDIGISPSATGEVLSPEEVELAKLGYKQEFAREFSWLATFSFAFSISGLLATVRYNTRLPGGVADEGR
jgi:hypothetical protein